MSTLVAETQTNWNMGMLDSVSVSKMPSDSASLILNGRIMPDASVIRRDGTQRTHSAALVASATGFGGKLFTTAAGVRQLVAFFATKAFRSVDYGATFAEIATGLRQDYYSFATMRVGSTNYLYAANGDTTIKQWNGTTWTTLSNAPSGVKYIAVFNGRLWAAGHNGVVVQGSKIADPTVWSSAAGGVAVQVLTHDGLELTGLHQIGPHLLVFDRQATSYIDGFGDQTLVVASGGTGFSGSVGCIAFRSIVSVGDNAVCWLSERGIEHYSPGSGIQLVSKGVQEFLSGIARDHIFANPGTPSAVYDEQTQDYHLALATLGTRNNRSVVLNLLQNVQWQRPGPRAAASLDRYVDPDGALFFALGSDGYLTTTGDSSGWEMKAGSDDYLEIVTDGSGGEAMGVDSGYLSSVTNDTLPASLFMGPTDDGVLRIYSCGYDGFVRLHEEGDGDDVLSDGTGGSDVTLTFTPRPFLFGLPRHRKRARVVNVAGTSPTQAEVSVVVRAGGRQSAARTLTIPSASLDQPKRARVSVTGSGDAPEVVLTTSDKLRITLVSLAAEPLQERIP